MKVYGELEHAKLESLASDPTVDDLYEGRIWYNTTDETVKARRSSHTETISPVGSVIDFAGSSAPDGWLICNGATLDSVANTQYAALYAVIGTIYGGTGADDFKLPDAQGRMTMGVGSGAGLTERSLGDSSGDETKDVTHSHSHNHKWLEEQLNYDGSLDRSRSFDSGGSATNLGRSSADDKQGYWISVETSTTQHLGGKDHYTNNDATSGGSATQDVMNPFLALNKIIKY